VSLSYEDYVNIGALLKQSRNDLLDVSAIVAKAPKCFGYQRLVTKAISANDKMRMILSGDFHCEYPDEDSCRIYYGKPGGGQ